MTKQEQKVAAFEAYEAIEKPAYKTFVAYEALAYKTYIAIKKPAREAYEAELKRIDNEPAVSAN